MELFVNARFLLQPLTGVQRYSAEVLRRLPSSILVTPGVPLTSYKEVVAGHRLLVRGTPLMAKAGFGHIWEQTVLPVVVTMRRGLLWSPGGSGPGVLRNQVLTVHDLAHIEHPEWYDPKFAAFYRALLPVLIRQVRSILTVSSFTKERLVELYRIKPEKIHITPLGVDARFMPAQADRVAFIRKKYGLLKPYLVVVSSISERKNLRRLVQAWVHASLGKEMDLVVVGAAGLPFARDSGLPEAPAVRWLGYIPEEDLPLLYSGALGAVYVSLYEGFGLPVIEAMACGTPVIASNVAALPEVVGDAGVLVDPYDVEAIAEGIKRLVEDSNLRTELRRKGLNQVKSYTWDRTAELTWKALQEAMED